MQIKNLILGAGISGLSASSELGKKDTIIFEKEKYYGGLCNSFKIGEFIFDTSIHLSFTNIAEVRQEFDKCEYYKHLPLAYNYYEKKWLKHPVVHNLFNMEIEDKVKCIKGFVERPHFDNIINYKEWLVATYGKDIVEKFHEKYTRKYWCKELSELSTTWVGARLNTPKIENMLNGAFKENDNIEYYAKEMRYPKNGGYKGFLNNLANNAEIKYNKEANKVDVENKIVYFKDGSKCAYKNLISSIPICELIKIIDNVPDEIVECSKRLIATSMALVSVGFNKSNIAKHLWFYVYDEDILASRVYSPSLKSINNAEGGCSSLQFEIYYTKEKPIKKTGDEVINHIKDFIINGEIAKEDEILFMDYREIKYANVIFYNGMEADREKVKEYLELQGIILIGRFGEWDYLWSDQSYMSGKKVKYIL